MKFYTNPDELTVGYIVMVSTFSLEFLLACFGETFLAPSTFKKTNKKNPLFEVISLHGPMGPL